MPSRTTNKFAPPATILLTLLALGLFGNPRTANAEIRVEAFSGQPLGVGRIVVDVPSEGASAAMNDDRTTVTDAAGRVLYPTVEPSRERKVLRSLLGVQLPRRVTFYFLFHGNERLDLELYLPQRVQVTVVPRDDRRGYNELLGEWWKAYVAMYSRVHREADYPIGVQTYLTAMWAGRLGQPMPKLEGFLVREQEQGGTVVGKLMADEAHRASVLRDLMLGELDSGEATMPLPDVALPVTDLQLETQVEVAIEPMASHVPDDCYYVRFGTFANYLWFKDFLGRWQGDLGNMLIQRSIYRSSSEQISAMLGLAESKVSAILGPQVIDDVALIGFDPYFADGASVGVLFHAKNNFLLSTSFNQQRSAAAKAVEGAKLEQLDIAGKKVSYLTSPDGSLRSYYATDGNFHLVTSSRRIVERFYEAAAGQRQLAAAPDFLAARMAYPIERDDRVFVHLSSAFFRNLVSPGYRIELDRRLRSLETQRGLELARLAAAQENLPNETEEELASGAFLPGGFSQRADGARWTVDDNGRRVESVRGYRGHFTPIADSVPELVSESELRRYEQFLGDLRREAGNLVPVTAVIHRDEVEPGIERIAIDLFLQRYSTTNLASWAKKLGPASNLRLAPIAGDLASANVVLDGVLGGGEPFHLFGGIRDGVFPLTIAGGNVEVPLQLLSAIEGYVGTWPKPAFLERFLGRPAGPYDANGMARTTGLFDLWVRRADDFMLFSFKERVLFDVGTQIAMVEAARPAQAWVQIQDILGTQYEGVATALAYARTRDTSASASRFMNSLVRQLHVEPAAAYELANELVGGEFLCPLGGEYELAEIPGGLEVWTSTAAAPNNQFLLTEVPGDYRFPLLEWFRGMSAELVRGEDSLTLSAEVFISGERPAPGAPRAPLAPQAPSAPTAPPVPTTPAAPGVPRDVEELPPPPPQPPRNP
ncbi:hypothetical protein [Aeoliella sp. SH292]|uniref:hypothetical protein n=1 Tax=Aeoliella sp. SH292 TaxID=3454464 RepID=UPI003F9AF12A